MAMFLIYLVGFYLSITFGLFISHHDLTGYNFSPNKLKIIFGWPYYLIRF